MWKKKFFNRNINENNSDRLSLIYPHSKNNDFSYGSINSRGAIDDRFKINKGKSGTKNQNVEIESKSGILGLFRYSSSGDRLLMLIGILFSIFTGASFPVLALVFGKMTNTFIIQATHGMNTLHKPTDSPLSGYHKYLYSSTNAFHRDIFNDFSTDSDNAFVKLQTEKMSTTTSSVPLHSNFTSNITNEQLPLSSEEFSAYMGKFSLYYLAIGLTVLLCAYIQTFCWELAAERQVHRLHGLFFSQILRQDVSWYDMRNREEGDLTTKLSDDLERIREGIGSKFSMVTQYVSTFFSGIAVGLIANWQLTSGILCLGPILIGTSAYLARNSSSAAAREQLKYSLAGGVADEVLNSIRTVVAFGGEFMEINRYDKALEEGRRLAMRKYYVMGVGAAIVFFLMYSAFGIAFWYGAELIGAGKSTPGSVFTVFFSVMAGAFSVGNALPFITAVSTAVGAAKTIFGIIDRVPDIDPYSNNGYSPFLYSKTITNSVKGHIQFKDVHFAYPARSDVPVLKGLNVEIEPGKSVALVGNSGAGKSTIVSLLMRFYDPLSGEILIDGMQLHDYNLSWLRNQIGIVSQEPVLFGMSIEENIKFGFPANYDDSKITSSEIIKAATLANAHKFISELPNGYATLVGTRGAQLSGGQKQRIAIARAIVRDPKILLLDEATSALDTQSEGIVQDALDQAMKGRTTIIIAHRLSTVRNADVIYALKDGVVGEVGNHDQLMSIKGLYYNLVTTQTQESADEKELCSEEQGVKNAENQSGDIKKEGSGTMEIQNLSEKSMGQINYGFDEIQEDNSTRRESVNQKEEAVISEYHGSIVWRLLKLNSPEWFWLFLGILGCAFTGMTMPTFAFFYGQIFSTFTLVGDQMKSAALFWSLMFLVLASVTGLSFLLQISFMTLASEKLVARMRLMAFRSIVRQPIGWFDVEVNSPGRLITKLARDAPMVKQAAGLRAGHLISALVTLLSALIIAFIYGWKLACLLVIGVPLIAGASYQQTLIIRRNQTRDLKLMDSAGRVAVECVSNIRTVQGLNKELLFLKLYNDYLELPFREAKKQALVYAAVFSFSQAIIFVMYAAAFKFGAYLIETGDMTPTDVYRVFFALAFCAAAVGQTSAYVKDYYKAKIAAQCLFKLIENKSDIDIDSPNGIKPVINGKVTFDSVHFKYPSRPDVNILNGISFSVEPGKSLALVGSSGCGKSTVVALLERFYNPPQGNIIIDDFDIRSFNIKYLRRNIGLVTQEPVLFNRSIKDNILYGLEDDEQLTMDDVIKSARAANIHNFIAGLPQGYDTFVGEGGSKLSGGQKQRVAIARALIRDPKILLLDEATSALDTESEKIVQEALDRAREGRTCIIIAHRLSTIQNADCIAVIHQGVIVEQGTHEELKNKGQRYYQLIKRQNL